MGQRKLLGAVGGRANLVRNVDTTLLRESGGLVEVDTGVGASERFEARARGLAVRGGLGGRVEALNSAAAPAKGAPVGNKREARAQV